MKEVAWNVLSAVIKEHTKTAKPVSSDVLFEKYNLGIAPATIRLYLKRLEKEGYLSQPHTSAGRVPTQKAYREFVAKMMEGGEEKISTNKEFVKEVKTEVCSAASKDEDKRWALVDVLAKKMHGVCFLKDNDQVFWQGLSYLVQEPEFLERSLLLEASRQIEQIYSIFLGDIDFVDDNLFRVFIGDEESFLDLEDLSFLVSPLNESKDDFIGFLGPVRMDYKKNIRLLKVAKDIYDSI